MVPGLDAEVTRSRLAMVFGNDVQPHSGAGKRGGLAKLSGADALKAPPAVMDSDLRRRRDLHWLRRWRLMDAELMVDRS